MTSRALFPAVFLLVPGFLYAQSECAGLTFSGTKEASLSNGITDTALVRQPDGSYYAVTLHAKTFQLGNFFSDYQNVIQSGCGSGTPTTALPQIPNHAPALGVGSQILALADFQNTGIPAGVFVLTQPTPLVSVATLSLISGVSINDYVTSSDAAAVAAGDFNKDGKYDFVAVVGGDGTAQNPGGVQIFLGNGDGTFKLAASYTTGIDASSVTVADVNNDSKLDLVVCGYGTSAVSVLLGNGDGTFHAAAASPVAGKNPSTVIAADFNNDQKLDLAVSNLEGTVSIFLGNGDGSFGAAKTYPAGSNCGFLAAGDFNGDGKPDLVVSNVNPGLLAILLNNGDGTFGAPSLYAGGSLPISLILTDFNNDGKLDIVVGTGTPDYIGPNSGSGNLDLLIGNGDGTFQGTQLLSAGKSSRALAVTDLNADGKLDVVVGNEGSGDLTVFLGQGGGKFQALPPYSLVSVGTGGPASEAAADFNRDGKMDIATVEYYSQSLAISLGNGDGTFQAPTVLAAGTMPTVVAAGDLNGDGKPDLVVADGGSLEPGSQDEGAVLVFLSTGSGFQPVKRFAAGPYPTSVAIVDVNLDGKPDLVVSNQGPLNTVGGGVAVLLGNGDGTFGTATLYTAGTFEQTLAVADVNGDGKSDIILPALDSNSNEEVLIFLGKGDGTFMPPSALMASQPASNVIVGDFNGDGKPDLLLANCCGDTSMSYFLGNGDGTFQPEALFNGGPNPNFVASADFNNDGKPDLAIASNQTSGALVILLNTTPSAPANMTANSGTTPQSAATGSTFANALAVTVTDLAGHPVAGVSVTFTAPSTGASAIFPGNANTFTTTTNSSGVATAAALSANASAGSYSVTAASTGLPTVAFALTNTSATTHPAFFTGEVSLGSGVYYLQFPDNSLFGYYNYVTSSILYHYDMGFEAFIPSTAGQIYFYDFASGHWWYSSASLFPYLYDFTLNTFIYYFPDTKNAGHYTTNPRYFSNLTTGKIFSM